MMATVGIPLSGTDEHFDLQVTLDGVTLLLEFRWNARNESWYLDVLTPESEAIGSSRKVVTGWPLMLRGARDTDERLPGGEIFALDTSGQGLRPGRNDLGSRVRLYYDEADA